MQNLSYVTTAQFTTIARASYVVLFDLKPLNEDGNLQVVCIQCSGASEAPFCACLQYIYTCICTVGMSMYCRHEFFQKLFVLLFGTAKRQCIALQDSDATLLCFCVNCDSPRNASLVATIIGLLY